MVLEEEQKQRICEHHNIVMVLKKWDKKQTNRVAIVKVKDGFVENVIKNININGG